MYFPYLRGGQSELLALKSLAAKGLIGKKVLPVIEPVSINNSLKAAIETFADKNLKLALVLNPEKWLYPDAETESLMGCLNKSAIPALIVNNSFRSAADKLKSYNIEKKDVLTILRNRDYAAEYQEYFSENSPKYTLSANDRLIKSTVTENKVLFEDKFRKRSRNADYSENTDEFFSDDHLYYIEEGYCGFGDYTVVGDSYEKNKSVSGALAIHITYFDDDNTLRLHHFVSDSSYGTGSIADKFSEAVRKLEKWDQNKYNTYGISLLLDYARQGYYPGLANIKKLSVMHHLELMNKFLES